MLFTPPNLKPQMQMPFICLLGGMFVCFLALVGAYTGKVWAKFQGWVYRAKEPKWFWFIVAVYFLIGGSLIGCYFYLVN
jgi:hypothetical protein